MKTSDFDRQYNCIGFAMGEQRKWWPIQMTGWYWPLTAPLIDAIESFIAAFATRGYHVTDNELFEPGFEKVALFALNGQPKHAALQLPSGRWKSKLGDAEDIEHDLRGVEGRTYGAVVLIFCRALTPRIAP